MTNPRSTMQIAGHPIHPMLIPFPIAFLVTTLVADLAYWGTGNSIWATAALWLVGAGVVMALLAAVAGFVDFVSEPRIRALSDSWQHFLGNLLAVAISVFNWYWHLGGAAAVLPWGLVLSAIVVCILLFTGWKGWEMVYRAHVGVADATPETRAEQRRTA